MSEAAASAGGEDNGGDRKGTGKATAEDLFSPPLRDSDEDEELEVDGKRKRRSTLDCLASLEKSLPMKRGISGHYDGRSKSFDNLSELAGIESTQDLVKKEHAINKRRRLPIAHERYHEKSSTAAGNMTRTSSLPIKLHTNQDEDDEEDDKEEKGNDDDHKEQAGRK